MERIEESAWSKCRTFKVTSSFLRERPRKTWNQIIRIDLKERKVSKDRNAWNFFVRNRAIHASMKNRR